MGILSENVIDLQHRQSELKARAADRHRPPADPIEAAETQARYDASYRSIDAPGAPAPLPGESCQTYEARVVSELSGFHPGLRRVDVFALAPAELRVVGDEVRAAVQRAVDSPTQPDFADPSKLRRVDTVDPVSGQRIIEWRGNSKSFIQLFEPAYQTLVKRHVGDKTPVYRWID